MTEEIQATSLQDGIDAFIANMAKHAPTLLRRKSGRGVRELRQRA